jgi:hypothetical protein
MASPTLAPWIGHGAGSPGAPTATAAHRSARNAMAPRRWTLQLASAPAPSSTPPSALAPRPRCPGRLKWCRVCMRPVEPHRPLPGNPGVSRCAPRPGGDVGASAVIAPRGPCGRAASTGSAWLRRVERHRGPGASTRHCSNGCRDHSGCTAPPARGSAHTGTAAPDDPCPPRASRGCWTDSPQRATLRWHRLQRHGAGCGTVFRLARVKGPLPHPPSSAQCAVVARRTSGGCRHSAAAQRYAAPATGRPLTTSVACACLAALQGGQAGEHTSTKAPLTSSQPRVANQSDQIRCLTAE